MAVLMLGVLPAPSWAVDIHLWEFPRIPDPADPHDRFSWIKQLLQQFESRHPGVRVHLTELTWKSGQDKLKIAVYAGAPPDLTSGVLPVKLAAEGVLDPVDEYLRDEDRADYLPGTLESFQHGGSTGGWPWCTVGDLLFLNLDLARKTGVEPPPEGQWPWSRFRQAMADLTVDADRDGVPETHGFGFVSVKDRQADFGLLRMDGAELLPRQGGEGLGSPQALQSLQRMLQLIQVDKVAPENCGGMEPKDLWQGFFERRSIACAPFGLWALKALEKRKPFDFTIAAFPHIPPADRGRSPTATSGYMVFRQDDGEKRRLCHELARFLTSGSNQRLLAGYGQFPTRRSAGDIYPGSPRMRLAQKILAGGYPLPVHSSWARMDARIKAGVQRVLLGERQPGEELKAMDAEIRALSAASRGTANRGTRRGRSADPPVLTVALVILGAFLSCLMVPRVRRRLGDPSAYGFLLPSLSIFGIFMLWPVIRAFLLAFQEYSPGAGALEGFVGLRNFERIQGNEGFWRAVANTAVYTALVVPAQIGVGLILASLLYPLASRARNFFRAAFYLPGVASVVVLAMVWRWLYDDTFGLANNLLATAAGAPLYQLLANLKPLLARPGPALAFVYTSLFLCMVARSLFDSEKAGWIVAALAVLSGFGWIGLSLTWAWRPFEPVRWLTSTDLSLFSIALTSILRGPGGALLIYLAALEAIPSELFEAARSDGAGPLAQWWHVMLPLVKPTTLFLAVTGAIDSFQVFAQVLMLTDGGPAGSSTVLVHQIYVRAFRDLEFGEASAMALLLFLVLVTVSAIQYRFLRSDWEL